MKFAICSVVKNENLYIKEWVDYHIGIGVNKIILYDNNPPGGELVSVVLQEYVDRGIVDIYPVNESKVTGMESLVDLQMTLYNQCMDQYQDYDWIAFVDVDEFIVLLRYNNLHCHFNAYSVYNEYDNIIVNWHMMGDPNALYYEDKPVRERFQIPINGVYGWYGEESINGDFFVKSFVKPSSEARFTHSIHCTNSSNVCNPYGLKCRTDEWTTNLIGISHELIRIDHYFTKSLTECLCKSIGSKHKGTIEDVVDEYKRFNGWSDKHEQVLQNFIKQHGNK